MAIYYINIRDAMYLFDGNFKLQINLGDLKVREMILSSIMCLYIIEILKMF